MWEKVGEPGRPQKTIWHVRISWWITKAINRQSEFLTHCLSTAKMFAQKRLDVMFVCILSLFFKLALGCGNKMPTRCNRWFLLQILLLAQHVSGTIMPIIRSSRALYRWLLPMVFGALVFKLSVWCGAEGYVSGLRAAAWKPKHQIRQAATTCIIISGSWWWA